LKGGESNISVGHLDHQLKFHDYSHKKGGFHLHSMDKDIEGKSRL